MIISDKDNKVFCHIPKKGGTSLRDYFLRSFGSPRELQGRTHIYGKINKTIDITHLTVYEACEIYDEKILQNEYTVIAVLRDPIKRVKSSIYQYLRSFGPNKNDVINKKEIEEFINNIDIRKACYMSRKDYKYIHFRPQSDFIEYVKKDNLILVPIDKINYMYPSVSKENVRGVYPEWLKYFNSRINKAMFDMISPDVKKLIKNSIITQDKKIDKIISKK